MDPRDEVNLIITTAWIAGALVCWFQPQISRSRFNSGRPSRGPVSTELRVASTATCAILAVGTIIAIPIDHGAVPLWLGQGLAAMGGVALIFTLIILFRERRAGSR